MNAVVITDHNSVGFIRKVEEVKKQYEDENFKIFYGIELCVSAEFTHILIVFNDNMTVTQIEDAIISDLGLKRENWSDTEINVSEKQLKNLCNEMRRDIFVIPAHFASNKGLGKANLNAIKSYQDFVHFDAIEIRNEHDIDEYKNKVINRAINQAVLVTGSDNSSDLDEAEHCVEGIGKKYTWMKMSSLSFEGIRQVFIDPEHRCFNWIQIQNMSKDFDPNEVSYNYVSGIKINGITHISENMSMTFSPYLNCIVGGRGTGKSTIVQAIKYGLDPSLELSQCKLLSKTFDKDGEIDTRFQFGDNKTYIIETKKSGKGLIHNCYLGSDRVEIPPEFKIDFYGQKEIFELIDEDSNVVDCGESPLVRMIDEKIKTKIYGVNDEIEHSLSELMGLSELYRNNRRKIKELPTIKAEIDKAEAILKKFKDSGIEDARKRLDEISALVEICKKEIFAHNYYLSNLNRELVDKINGINEKIELVKKKEEKAVPIFLEQLRNSYLIINNAILQGQERGKSIEIEFNKSYILEDFENIKKIYLASLEELKNTGSENIQVVQDRLLECKKREKELLEIQKQQSDIERKMRNVISIFIQNRLKLSEYRREMISSLEFENIKINIHPLAHKSRWRQLLQKEVGKEGAFEVEFEKLVEAVLVKDDFTKYEDFLLFLLTSEDGNLSQVTNESFDGRFCKIWETKGKNETLGSLVKVVPEDYISIKIIEETGEIDINEGSPGQKSAAILTFILSSGTNPLIIDQPEDDLDNSLIYNLVVKSIRKMKNKRQIIIVTHNPNIPVLGDAEGIIILERNTKGKVAFRKNKKAGCIEEKLIRQGICDIMEGGEGAFKKREEKYLYRY